MESSKEKYYVLALRWIPWFIFWCCTISLFNLILKVSVLKLFMLPITYELIESGINNTFKLIFSKALSKEITRMIRNQTIEEIKKVWDEEDKKESQ